MIRMYSIKYDKFGQYIASRIGGGGLDGLLDPVVNPEGKWNEMNVRVGGGWKPRCFCREETAPKRSRSLGEIAAPVQEPQSEPEKPGELPPCSENEYKVYFNTELRFLYEYKEKLHDEPETYFYHPDHLGSSSWITDASGDAIQHLQYLPFGEQYVDQRTTGWNAMFTFSGKERDEETGYGYFGARYYDSDISIWLSVDPLADKYPMLSPYVYCANNPVKLVDPDGMEVIITGDQTQQAFTSLQQGTNLTLSMDNNGKITAEGIASNDNDQQLYDAINSADVTVNINASNQNNTGEYHGTTYDAGTNTAASLNKVNVSELSSLEKSGAEGSGMMHEVTEGYQMGLISIDNKSDISAAEQIRKKETIVGSGWSKTIYSDTPVNPRDYALYDKGHSQATKAPNEMTRRQASGYKSPQLEYVLPRIGQFKSIFQYR